MPGDRVFVGQYGPNGKKNEKVQFGQATIVSERPENDRRRSEKHLRRIFGEYTGDEIAQKAIKKLLKSGWSIKSADSADILKLIPKSHAEIRAAVEENFEKVRASSLEREERGSLKEKAGKMVATENADIVEAEGRGAEKPGIGQEALKEMISAIRDRTSGIFRQIEGIDPESENADALIERPYTLSISDFVGQENLSREEMAEIEAEVGAFTEVVESEIAAKRDERKAWLIVQAEAAAEAGKGPDVQVAADSAEVAEKGSAEAQPVGKAKSAEQSAVAPKAADLPKRRGKSPEDVFGQQAVESWDKKLYKPDGFWMVIHDFNVRFKIAKVEFGNPRGDSKERNVSQAELEGYLKEYNLSDDPLKAKLSREAPVPKREEIVREDLRQEFSEIYHKNLFDEKGDWIYVSRILEKGGKIEIAKGASGDNKQRVSRITPEKLREYLKTFRLQSPEAGAGVPKPELPELQATSPEPQNQSVDGDPVIGKAEKRLSSAEAMDKLNAIIDKDGEKRLRVIERINPASDMSEQHLEKDYLMRMEKYPTVGVEAEDLVAFEAKIASFNREISYMLQGKLTEREDVLASRTREVASEAPESGSAESGSEKMLKILQKYQGRLADILRFIRAIDIERDEAGADFSRVPKRIYTDINMSDLEVEEMRRVVEEVNVMNEKIEKAYVRKKGLWEGRQARKNSGRMAQPVAGQPSADKSVQMPENPVGEEKTAEGEVSQPTHQEIPAAAGVRENVPEAGANTTVGKTDSQAESASQLSPEAAQETVGGHPMQSEIVEAEIVEETDIEKVQREVDEARMRYVRANRKSTGLVAKLKKFFQGSAAVPESDDAAARYLELYQDKSRRLLKLKMDQLKKDSRQAGVDTRQRAREMIKYFTFDEKIKLYEAGNDARAEEVEKRFGKWPGAMAKKFTSFINGYRKLGWKKKMFFSTALFASGAGFAVQGVYRAFTSTASAVGAGGMYEAWQRRKDSKELESEQAKIESEAKKAVNPEESYQRVMEMLSARIGQYDKSLSQQKKRRWGKWTVGLGMGVGAFFFGPKIFQGIREFFGDSVGTAPTPGEAEFQGSGTGTQYPDTEALERSFNDKLGQDWGAGRELEYSHKITQGAPGGNALNYDPEIQKPSLMTPDEIDRRIQDMLAGGKTLEVSGQGSSIESTLIGHLEGGGLPPQEAGSAAHRMALQYAKDQGIAFEKLNLVHEGAEIRLSPDGSKILSVIDGQNNDLSQAGEAVQSADADVPQAEAESSQALPEDSIPVPPEVEPESGTQFSQDLMGPGESDVMPAESEVKMPDQAPDNLPDLGDLDDGSIKSINEALASHKDGWAGDEYAMVQRDLEVSRVINKCLVDGDLSVWKAGKDVVMEEILANPHGSVLAQQANRLHNHFLDLADRQPEIAQQIRKALEPRPNETLEHWTGRLSITTRMLNIDKI